MTVRELEEYLAQVENKDSQVIVSVGNPLISAEFEIEDAVYPCFKGLGFMVCHTLRYAVGSTVGLLVFTEGEYDFRPHWAEEDEDKT